MSFAVREMSCVTEDELEERNRDENDWGAGGTGGAGAVNGWSVAKRENGRSSGCELVCTGVGRAGT